MNTRILIAGVIALGLTAGGAAYAQTTTPSTSPPERMNGSTTMDNPATATTPQPGSPAALSAPATTAPALGTPADTAPGAARTGAHSDATHSDATPGGAPVSGANSFTEGQARSRMQDRGFAQVSELKLDAQGVWRAKATKDGKTVTVALDYQGNVVSE